MPVLIIRVDPRNLNTLKAEKIDPGRILLPTATDYSKNDEHLVSLSESLV